MGMKMEKPEVAPSGFMQELPQTSGSPKQYFFSTAPSGCLQGRRNARGVTGSHSLSMVRVSFLHLPKLLEGPGLLL
jgi:hypothetical protein